MSMLAPDEIDDHVAKFLGQISLGQFYYVPVEPISDGIVGECFFNCRNHMERSGSRVIFGWAIWELKGKMLEAEHHSICDLNGKRFCVSPHIDGVSRILFLEDPSATYNFSDRRSNRENRFYNRCGFKLVDELISARLRLIRLIRENQSANGIVNMNADQYERLQQEVSRPLK